MLSISEKRIYIGLVLKKLASLYRRKVVDVQSRIPGVSDVTTVQGWVICFIYDQCKIGDVFQRDVENELDIRKSSATTLLQRMEKNGFLVREPLRHDARWKKLVLTQKAVDFRNKLKDRMSLVEAHAVKGIASQQLDQFLMVAEAIANNLDQHWPEGYLDEYSCES